MRCRSSFASYTILVHSDSGRLALHAKRNRRPFDVRAFNPVAGRLGLDERTRQGLLPDIDQMAINRGRQLRGGLVGHGNPVFNLVAGILAQLLNQMDDLAGQALADQFIVQLARQLNRNESIRVDIGDAVPGLTQDVYLIRLKGMTVQLQGLARFPGSASVRG